jgi:hypothetical protein
MTKILAEREIGQPVRGVVFDALPAEVQDVPEHPDYARTVALVLRTAPGRLEDRCGDPLASAAALVEGSATGATSECRSCEVSQYRLGYHRKQRL